MDETSEDLVAKLVNGLDTGALVTKFVVIAEGIDTNGSRAVYITTNDTAMAHDTIGLLEYVITREKAALFKSIMGEES